MTTSVFKVSGMHCSSCGMLIDDSVEELSGVARSETDVRRGSTKVDFDPAAVDANAIISAIESAGYRAELSS